MIDLITIHAGIFSWLSGIFSERAFEAIGALLILVLGLLTKKYIIPLLKTARDRQIAEHVLTIADDVTDYFLERFPQAHWSVWLDRAIDKIIEVTGVGRGPAERAARAALSRKKRAGDSQGEKIEART